MTGVIYALCDPTTGEARYVGQTRQRPVVRLRQHVRDARARRHIRVTYWLESIDYAPDLVILEETDDLNAAEQRWIAELRAAGASLVNLTDGGAGMNGVRHTEESRAKISAAHRGKTLTPDHREKLSAAHTGVPLQPHHREAIGRGGKGRIVTPVQRARMAAAKRGDLNPMSRAARARRAGVV